MSWQVMRINIPAKHLGAHSPRVSHGYSRLLAIVFFSFTGVTLGEEWQQGSLPSENVLQANATALTISRNTAATSPLKLTPFETQRLATARSAVANTLIGRQSSPRIDAFLARAAPTPIDASGLQQRVGQINAAMAGVDMQKFTADIHDQYSQTLLQLSPQATNPAGVTAKPLSTPGEAAISGEFQLANVARTTNDIHARVREFIQANAAAFGLSKSTVINAGGYCDRLLCITRVKRAVGTLPVFGGDLVVMSKNNTVLRITGNTNALPSGPSSQQGRAANALEDIALSHLKYSGAPLWRPTQTEQGFRFQQGAFREVYKLQVALSPINIWDVFIEARSGKVIDTLTKVYEQSFVNASGIDLAGMPVNFRAQQNSNISFFMVDDSVPAPGDSSSTTTVVDFQRTTTNAIYVNASSAIGPWEAAGVSALANSRASYLYYSNTFGRQGIDGNDGSMLAAVHYDTNLANAFYVDVDGGRMYYGEGDGNTSGNLAASLDIAGHELTHGVVARTAGLEYRYQSGALNESFADFFGTQIDGDDWLIGEDIWLQGPDCGGGQRCLRNLSDPTRAASSQPAHMNDYQNLPIDVDNGGVHVNSGIPNYALYLLAEGLPNSLGRGKAASIAYATLSALNPTSGFQEAADTMYFIALNYSATDAQAVVDAWRLVGIVIDAGDAPSPPPPVAPSIGENAIVHAYPGPSGLTLGFQDMADTAPSFNLDTPIGDGANPYSWNRASVSPYDGDGTYAPGYYVAYIENAGDNATNRKVRLTYVNKDAWAQAGTYAPLDFSGPVSSAALSPNVGVGTGYIALVFDNDPSIYVYSVADASTERFEIRGPDYTQDGSAPNLVIGVDSVRWDPSERKIAFDYLSCSRNADNNCSYYWSIGIVNRFAGVSYPFASQSTLIDVGYPAFSNRSDRFIVFDYLQNAVNLETSEVIDQDVLVADTYTGTLYTTGIDARGNCANVNDFSGGVYAVPSFSSDDNGIIHSYCAINGSGFAQTSNHTTTFSGANAGLTQINPAASVLPFASPADEYVIVPSLTVTPEVLDLGIISYGTGKTVNGLCTQNNAAVSAEVTAVSSANGVTTTFAPFILRPGEEYCQSVTVAPPKILLAGNYFAFITFNGDAPAQSIIALTVGVAQPSAPAINSAVALDSESVLVTLSGDSGGDPDAVFTVTCGDVVQAINPGTAEVTNLGVTVSGLEPGTAYDCTVSVVNSAGSTASSSVAVETETAGGGLPIWLLLEATK